MRLLAIIFRYGRARTKCHARLHFATCILDMDSIHVLFHWISLLGGSRGYRDGGIVRKIDRATMGTNGDVYILWDRQPGSRDPDGLLLFVCIHVHEKCGYFVWYTHTWLDWLCGCRQCCRPTDYARSLDREDTTWEVYESVIDCSFVWTVIQGWLGVLGIFASYWLIRNGSRSSFSLQQCPINRTIRFLGPVGCKHTGWNLSSDVLFRTHCFLDLPKILPASSKWTRRQLGEFHVCQLLS